MIRFNSFEKQNFFAQLLNCVNKYRGNYSYKTLPQNILFLFQPTHDEKIQGRQNTKQKIE